MAYISEIFEDRGYKDINVIIGIKFKIIDF